MSGGIRDLKHKRVLASVQHGDIVPLSSLPRQTILGS